MPVISRDCVGVGRGVFLLLFRHSLLETKDGVFGIETVACIKLQFVPMSRR